MKGSDEVDLMGKSSREIGWVWAFLCWQTAQPMTKLLTKMERPGHQKSHSTTVLVRNHPR